MKYFKLILLALYSLLFINIIDAKAIKIADKAKISEKINEIINKKNSLVRKTSFGSVLGTTETTDGNDVLIWYGIPYGAAPVDDLRWAAPQDPKPWKDVRDCTKSAEMALQMSGGKAVGSEDCLNLDIYAPPNAKRLPVMVYIHGGNNQTGESKELIGNEIVIKDNCIYISLNYRLGIFGFNILPALHTKAGSTGNYALLDMAKALDWIKENAKEFGGDPNNITITGFSAGGRDVMAMLISPLFAGKFQKAIVFSGGMTIAPIEESIRRTAAAVAPLAVEDGVAKDEEKAKAWLMTDGEDVKKWLYSVKSERLCALMGNAGIRMSVFPHLFNDGVVIPKEGFDTTKWNSVPLIMLTSSTEFSFFNVYGDVWKTDEAKALTDLQAAKDFGTKYGSDMYRIFNAQSSAEKMYKKYKSKKIYLCQVDFGSENSAYKINTVGAFHGVFIPMLSNKVHGYTSFYDFEVSAYQSMGKIFNGQIKYFLRFGNPNGIGLPIWRKWTPKSPVSMVLDAANGKGTGKSKNVSTSYDEIIAKMEADTSVSDEGKKFVISKSMNGRWFSDAVDEHYKNPSLWV